MVYKILEEIDVDKLLAELSSFIDVNYNQQMLQGLKNQTDHQYGIGSYADYPEKEMDFKYTLIHSADYLNGIMKKNNFFRTRIMTMKNRHYSWHSDATYRIHIPLISNTETNFMVVEDTVIRMTPGYMYWVDTTRKHTYVNTSDEYRIHIVGCVK